jgi:hypothetical protein
MSTFNGIGTKLLGFSKVDEYGCCYATKWFTIFFLPIIPLERIRIKRDTENKYVFKYHILEQGKNPDWKNILSTYLYGWVLFPLFIFTPDILCVREVAHAIGVPETTFEDMYHTFDHFGIYQFMMAFSLVWTLTVIWKLKDWDEARGLPKKPEEGMFDFLVKKNKNAKLENDKDI